MGVITKFDQWILFLSVSRGELHSISTFTAVFVTWYESGRVKTWIRTSSWFVGLSSVGSLLRTCSSSRSAVMSQEMDHWAKCRRNSCVQDRSSSNSWSSFDIVWKGGRQRTHLTAMNSSRAVVSCVNVEMTRHAVRKAKGNTRRELLKGTCSISQVGLKLCTVPVGLRLASVSICSIGYSAVGCNRAFQTSSLRQSEAVICTRARNFSHKKKDREKNAKWRTTNGEVYGG